jgi:hypothetical protein
LADFCERRLVSRRGVEALPELAASALFQPDQLRCAEPREPLREVLAVRSVLGPPRHLDEQAVHLLEAVAEHRPVVLVEDVSPQMNPTFRIDAGTDVIGT